LAQRSDIEAHLARSLGVGPAANYGPNGLPIEVAMAFGLDPLFIDTDNPA
jgi:hypothetical protein